MNQEQAESLKSGTYYLITIIEPRLDEMKSHGLTKREQEKIESFLDVLYGMNKKYVRLSK